MYNNTLDEVGIFAYSMVKKYGKCIAVCESTANLWLKTYQAFEKYNTAVKPANPLTTKAIAEARIKTDKLDARTLAHLLRSNLLDKCYIANKKTREERSLLRLRTNLVQDTTRGMVIQIMPHSQLVSNCNPLLLTWENILISI
jgi:transposase